MSFDPTQILIMYPCLLLSLSVHEAAHAFMANRCGDSTARLMGRISLNPLVHIDPIGTVVMPLLMMITNIPYLIGWAKPVPFNPRNLKNVRRDPVLIAIAGPLSNLLLAVITMVGLRLVVGFGFLTAEETLGSIGGSIALFLVSINLALMLFNLLPVPPLDGHYVLHYFLPPAGQRVMEQIGPFGIVIAIILIQTLGILHGPMNLLLSGVVRFILWV